ncbi:MAG: TraR/DksA C4-type zinc finger protein [bacterium]
MSTAKKSKTPAKAKPAAKSQKKAATAKKPEVKSKAAPSKPKLSKKIPPVVGKSKPATKTAPAAKSPTVTPRKSDAAKKSAPVSSKPEPSTKKPVASKSVAQKPLAKKPQMPPKAAPDKKAEPRKKAPAIVEKTPPRPVKASGWLAKQRDRLLQLKDTLLDSMSGVGRDSLRNRAEGSEASAFGMHTADAGSDAYDRDFALSLLSQERDSLYEIDAALKKITDGNYGVCELSGKPIPHNRLEALPFARYTVECQAELEKSNRLTRVRQPVTSLFGLGEESEGESEEEDTTTDTKD